MKRKFVKVMFFGALALSTITYVGCKDYDDDINAINERIDANDAKLAKIQEVLDSGQWVKEVKPIADGIQVVLGNNTTYDITNGTDGKDGINGTDGIVYTIGEDGYWYKGTEKTQWKAAGDTPYIGENGNWWIGDTDLKVQAEGKDGANGSNGADGSNGTNGTNGTNGLTPYIGTNGNWWIGEGAAAKDLGVKAQADVYTPDASGIWYLNGKPTDPAMSWKAEGTITAAVNKDGNIVISGMKDYPDGYVLKVNIAVLNSLVFEPQSYLGGIQAMKAISLNYNQWTVKTSDANPTKTGEVWQQAANASVLSPRIVAYYHVNPQNISEEQIVKNSVKYIAANKEVVTRSEQKFNPTVTSYDLVNKTIDGKNCRMLKVVFAVTSEEIKALDADEVSTLALQVSVKLENEAEPRVITSDYAAIYKTNWSDFVLAFKDKKGTKNEDGHLYGADGDLKGYAKAAINEDADFTLTATIDAENPKKLVLKDKFTFHYKEKADRDVPVNATEPKELVFDGNLDDLGLEIAFEQSNYISGKNKTPQNAFLKLEDGVAISAVYDEVGVAAADRQPLVRVMLRDKASKKVLNAGWVKINIVKDVVDGKEVIYPKHDDIYVGCEDVAIKTDVRFMNVDVYNALGLKKEEFHSIYQLDEEKTNPSTGDDNRIGIATELPDDADLQTILVKWTIDHADLIKAKEGDTFTKTVYYSATGRKDVKIIFTTGKVHKAIGTIGAKNINIWSGNSFNIDAKEPKSGSKATLANFDFYSVFMGNKIVTTVDGKFADFQSDKLSEPIFVFAEENGTLTAKKEVNVEGVKYYVYRNADGDKLMGSKGSAVAEEVATISGSKITYTQTDVAKALLNKSAYNEDPFTATIEVVIINDCKMPLPLTNGKFDAKFLRPVNITAGPVSTIQDAATGGAKVALNKLIALTDWRGHAFEMGTHNFYSYYGISKFAIDTENIKTNMGQTDPNKFELWTVVAPKYPDVVGYTEGTDTSGNWSAIENGDFGMITYDNKGMTIMTEFKLQIPVTVSYLYGDVTKTITVTVLPTHN